MRPGRSCRRPEINYTSWSEKHSHSKLQPESECRPYIPREAVPCPPTPRPAGPAAVAAKPCVWPGPTYHNCE